MQAVGFLIAGIVLHQSLSCHMFLYGRLAAPAVSVGHAIRVTTHSPTVLRFRCGCGYWWFVIQQIGLLSTMRQIIPCLIECVNQKSK